MHTDSWIEQTRSRLEDALEFTLMQQVDTFAFSPRISLTEEGNGLLALTSFESNNFVSKVTDEKSSFLITTPRRWTPKRSEEIIDKLIKLLELRSESDKELHVKEVEKRGTRIKIEK